MFLLIDGDILVYQAIMPSHVYKCQGKYFMTKKHAKDYYNTFYGELLYGHPIKTITNYPHPQTIRTQLKSMVEDIVRDVSLGIKDIDSSKLEHAVFLKGDKRNYRMEYLKKVPYKANRPAKPKQYELAREILAQQNEVVYANGQETDDLLGIIQTRLGSSSIIASKDKDLKTIPGFNYDPFHKKLTYISREEADRNFYAQILVGDRADNITGAFGIGPVKAAKILKDKHTPKQMLLAVLETYDRLYWLTRDELKEAVDERGKLMYIRREEGEIWSVDKVLR